MISEMNSVTSSISRIHNRKAIPLDAVTSLQDENFTDTLRQLLDERCRVSSYFGIRTPGQPTELFAVCADDRNGVLYLLRGIFSGNTFQSLTTQYPQLHLFEREIHEQTGLVPQGHPWLKPVRFPAGYSADSHADFFRVTGDDIHQVAVGPVHAGIIEPGHFRFQCHGETVFHLEIALGYQHRGIEEHLTGGPFPRTPFLIEAAAGDTSVGHAIAYSQILESLSSINVTPEAEKLRAIALELERCANHTGDLGALAGDVGFLPTLSYCGRIRGDFLNMTALLCGNRFGRGLVVPGGCGYSFDDDRQRELSKRMQSTFSDFLSATELLWTTPSVTERFESTGQLSKQTARAIGLVGPAARACGRSIDVRLHHPQGHYRFAHIPAAGYDTGDVFARAHIRWQEVQSSVEFILQEISGYMKAVPRMAAPETTPVLGRAISVSLVEGWRGEICHVAVTGEDGAFVRYKITDPSFHNWFGLALALRDAQISDFPLCNKSFNLSYCGFDL